jgi:hypothetical protein
MRLGRGASTHRPTTDRVDYCRQHCPGRGYLANSDEVRAVRSSLVETHANANPHGPLRSQCFRLQLEWTCGVCSGRRAVPRPRGNALSGNRWPGGLQPRPQSRRSLLLRSVPKRSDSQRRWPTCVGLPLIHNLRRSPASLLAEAGVSTAIAQKLRRQSDPKLTQNVYAPSPCPESGPTESRRSLENSEM